MRTLKMLGILLLLCLYFSPAKAQTAATTNYLPVTLNNVADALKLLKTDIFNVEVPIEGTKKYQLIVSLDEFAKDTLIKHQEIGLGEDIGEGTPGGKNNILSFIIQKKTDSTTYSVLKTAGGERIVILKNGAKYNLPHEFRPFKKQVIVPGKKMPVLLYGSMWHDPKIPANMLRFCMERVMDTNFSSDAFKNMPHHYIYSVELKEL